MSLTFEIVFKLTKLSINYISPSRLLVSLKLRV